MSLISKYQSGDVVTIGVVSHSIGQGYYANNYSLLPGGTDNPLVTGWVNQLRAFLQAKNASSNIINKSVAGYTTTAHISNNTIAQLAALNPKPDAVLISLQINDFRNVAWADFQANTRTLVQSVIDNGMTPILVKDNDIVDSLAIVGGSMQSGSVRSDGKTFLDFISEMDVVASEKNCSVIDIYTTFHAVLLASGDDWSATSEYYDSIHPNQAGHDVIFGLHQDWLEQNALPDFFTSGEPVLLGGSLLGSTTIPVYVQIGNTNIVKVINDSLTLSEYKDRIRGMVKIATDSLNLDESTNKLRGLVRVSTDSLSVDESVRRIRGLLRVKSEGVGINESTTRRRGIARTISEGIGIQDDLIHDAKPSKKKPHKFYEVAITAGSFSEAQTNSGEFTEKQISSNKFIERGNINES